MTYLFISRSGFGFNKPSLFLSFARMCFLSAAVILLIALYQSEDRSSLSLVAVIPLLATASLLGLLGGLLLRRRNQLLRDILPAEQSTLILSEQDK